MRWHLLPDKPSIDSSSTLCLVEMIDKTFDVVRFHKITNSFCKQHNSNFEIKDSNIIRWSYISDDDTALNEMSALIAIKATTQNVKDLISILLTDGVCCGKEYSNAIGLNELNAFYNKIKARINYLEDHIEINDSDIIQTEQKTAQQQKAEKESDIKNNSNNQEQPCQNEISAEVEDSNLNEIFIENTNQEKEAINQDDKAEEKEEEDIPSKVVLIEENDSNNIKNIPSDCFVLNFENKREAKHIKIHKAFIFGDACTIPPKNGVICMSDVFREMLVKIENHSKGCLKKLCTSKWRYNNSKRASLCLEKEINKEDLKLYESLDFISKDLKGCYVYRPKDNLCIINFLEDILNSVLHKGEDANFGVVVSHI